MTLTLDAASEQRVQHEIDRGLYRDPAEVVAHALTLLSPQPQIPQPQRTPEEKEKALDDAFGLWADTEEDGLAYQLRMRSEW